MTKKTGESSSTAEKRSKLELTGTNNKMENTCDTEWNAEKSEVSRGEKLNWKTSDVFHLPLNARWRGGKTATRLTATVAL